MLKSLRPALLALTIAAFGVCSTPIINAAQAATQVPGQTPADFIQNLGDKAIAVLGDKKLTPAERDTTFQNLLHDTFDLQTLGRFAIGRGGWAGATPEQQQEYMKLFEGLVIKTYTERFALYTGEGFKVKGSRAEGDHDFIVNADITHPNGAAPTTVDWRVRQKDGKLGIIDVVVEGVSMSVTQRQEYTSIIQRDGGSVDGLLKMMRDRLNGGAADQTK